MVIGGEKENLSQVESVELVSTDPNLYPVPDCLTELSVPEDTPWGRVGAAGALNYGGKSINFSIRLSQVCPNCCRGRAAIFLWRKEL